jgi:hypothetical protein
MIDKTWTKKQLLNFIKIYDIELGEDEVKDLPKKELSERLHSYLDSCLDMFVWNEEYPDIYEWSDLKSLLEQPKANTELDYRQKQEIIQDAKVLLNYCRQGYLISYTRFKDFDELFHLALKVSQHCDISTCRRAIGEFNKDPKVRNDIEAKISPRMKLILEQKKINKQSLCPKLTIRTEPITLTFD